MHLPLLIWASLLIQTAPAVQPSASFSGTVVDTLSGQPIPGAKVLFLKTGDSPKSEMTSSDGRFRFAALQPGPYNVEIQASGYVLGRYGEPTPFSGVQLSANQTKPEVRIELTPTGSISGRIYDSYNNPVANLTVHALRLNDINGEKKWSIVESRPTNDLGEYRFFWLDPGSYFIRAMQSDSVETYVNSPDRSIELNNVLSPIPPTRQRRVLDDGTMLDEATFPVYFPGTVISGKATSVDVRSGQDSSGVDFQFAAVPVHRIRGRIVGLTGSPNLSSSIRAIPLNSAINSAPDFDFSEFSARPDADQRFELIGFPAGTYLLLAEINVNDLRWSGRISVEVGNNDVSDLTIALTRNETVTGRFSINGTRSDDPSTEVLAEIRLVSTLAGSEYVEGVAEKNIVRFLAAPLGDYRVHIDRIGIRAAGRTEGSPAYIESIRSGAQDVLRNRLSVTSDPEQTLEISLRTDFGDLKGRVSGGKPEESRQIAVDLIPEFRDDHTRYRTTFADSSGQFQFSNVAPGNYKLFALVDFQNVEVRSVGTINYVIQIFRSDMSRFEDRGRPVSIRPGDNEVADLPIIIFSPGASRP